MASAVVSSSRRELIAKVRQIVPPMLESFHKGQLGRVAVVGGSEDYTGAPYFSAMASAKLGCDMSHVICTPAAGPIIKTYSPNLMVHPCLHPSQEESPSSSSSSTDPASSPALTPILDLLPRLHVLVIGPGLGRDPAILRTATAILRAARQRNIPVVLDADALLIPTRDAASVRGARDVVLTPNVVEFGRLWKSVGLPSGRDQTEKEEGEECGELARKFAGVTILRKGRVDVISDGETVYGGGSSDDDDGERRGWLVSDGSGGLKRSGGQGDTLTGCLATMLAWRKAYHEGLWDQVREGEEQGGNEKKMDERETLALAAWAGSAITREASRRAFEKKGRSLQASDLTEEVHAAFLEVIGEV